MTKLENAVAELIARVPKERLLQQLEEIKARDFKSPTIQEVVNGWNHPPPIVYQSAGQLMNLPIADTTFTPEITSGGDLFISHESKRNRCQYSSCIRL